MAALSLLLARLRSARYSTVPGDELSESSFDKKAASLARRPRASFYRNVLLVLFLCTITTIAGFLFGYRGAQHIKASQPTWAEQLPRGESSRRRSSLVKPRF